MAFPLRLPRRTESGSFLEPFYLHAQDLTAAAELVAELLGVHADRDRIAHETAALKARTDELSRDLVRTIDQTFITPIDREDLYELTLAMGETMDHLHECVDLICLYEITELPKGFTKQVSVAQRCAELTAAAMPQLRAHRGLADYWSEVIRLEATANQHHRKLRAKVLGGSYKTLEAIKILEIAGALEGAVDGFRKIAVGVERISIKDA